MAIDDPYAYLEDIDSKETFARLGRQNQKSQEYFDRLGKIEEIKERLVKTLTTTSAAHLKK